MTANPGDIITTHSSTEHWLVHSVVRFKEDVVQYQFLILENGTWGCYTAPFAGDLPSDIFKIVA